MVISEMVSCFYDWSYHACVECFQCCLLCSPILQLSHFFILGALLLMRLVMCGFRFIVLSRVVPSSTAESFISTWLFLTVMGILFYVS